jgi:hypothetical protein
MHIFVPDTNFFLQCFDYTMLDWSPVTDDTTITIAVPRVVQKEIDQHKDGGNGRRASRARRAWGLFAQVIDSAEDRVTAQLKSVTISLELLMPKIKAGDFPELNLQNPDDQIVAEALWVKQQHPDATVTFLSNDTPALTTAKSQHLPFLRLPQQWMLPPEKDERDKTIDELHKQIKALSTQQPELAFVLPGATDKRISASVTLFPELDDTDAEALMDVIRAQFPMETSFPNEPPAREDDGIFALGAMLAHRFDQWEPASAQAIDHYQKKAYPEWLRQIKSELRDIHHKLNANLLSKVTVMLENRGQLPAKNLLLTFEAQGSLIFGALPKRRNDGENDNAKPLLTAPPTPPSGAYVNVADRFMRMTTAPDFLSPGIGRSIPDITAMLATQRHDPNSFYWKPNRPTVEATEWTLECDEFRHQHEPYQVEIPFRANPASEGEASGVIRCKVHASNLPNVVELLIPVRINVERGDTLNLVRNELRGMH